MTSWKSLSKCLSSVPSEQGKWSAGMALATLTGDEQQTEQQRKTKRSKKQPVTKPGKQAGSSSKQMFGMQPSRRRSGSQCEDMDECLLDDGRLEDEQVDLSNFDIDGRTFTTAEILASDPRQDGVAAAQKRYDSKGLLEGSQQSTSLVPNETAEPKDAEIVQDDRPVWSVRRALTW